MVATGQGHAWGYQDTSKVVLQVETAVTVRSKILAAASMACDAEYVPSDIPGMGNAHHHDGLGIAYR